MKRNLFWPLLNWCDFFVHLSHVLPCHVRACTWHCLSVIHFFFQSIFQWNWWWNNTIFLWYCCAFHFSPSDKLNYLSSFHFKQRTTSNVNKLLQTNFVFALSSYETLRWFVSSLCPSNVGYSILYSLKMCVLMSNFLNVPGQREKTILVGSFTQKGMFVYIVTLSLL